MKFIAGLLALFVLYMSAKPEVDSLLTRSQIECCSTDYCSGGEESPPEQDDKCCDNGLCNPFLSCCAGTGFVLNFSAYELFLLDASVEKITGFEYNIHSLFAKDFWQPPKTG